MKNGLNNSLISKITIRIKKYLLIYKNFQGEDTRNINVTFVLIGKNVKYLY